MVFKCLLLARQTAPTHHAPFHWPSSRSTTSDLIVAVATHTSEPQSAGRHRWQTYLISSNGHMNLPHRPLLHLCFDWDSSYWIVFLMRSKFKTFIWIQWFLWLVMDRYTASCFSFICNDTGIRTGSSVAQTINNQLLVCKSDNLMHHWTMHWWPSNFSRLEW